MSENQSNTPDDGQEPDDSGREWDGPFDPDRAAKALDKKNREAKALRDRLKELEPLAAKAKELEEASKSETERLSEQLAAAKAEAEAAIREQQRYQVALNKGLDADLADLLTGNTVEELEKRADFLAERLAASQTPPPPGGRPRPRLVSGTQKDSEAEELSPAELANQVVAARDGL